MATSSSRAMKSSLVVVLLLSAVVASQAHQVSCKNTCENAMFLNGIWTDVGETTVLEVKNVIAVEVDEGEGVKQVVQFKCPEDVQALEFVYHGGGFVKSQIPDVNGRTTLHSGRRTLRESDRLGGKLDLVSKHRSLQAGGGILGHVGSAVNGVGATVDGVSGAVNHVRQFFSGVLGAIGNVRGDSGLVGGLVAPVRSTFDGAVGGVGGAVDGLVDDIDDGAVGNGP